MIKNFKYIRFNLLLQKYNQKKRVSVKVTIDVNLSCSKYCAKNKREVIFSVKESNGQEKQGVVVNTYVVILKEAY